MDEKVTHKIFGDGIVKNIYQGIIEIAFGDIVKKFQFPKAFDSFLVTDDSDLISLIEETRKTASTQENLIQSSPRSDKTMNTVGKYNNKKTNVHFFTKDICSPLVGDRAQNILVNSETEMFELIGYMAKPGRISSIEAEVPKDGRDEMFEKLFPGQIYRPIEISDTPSGMPNKIGPQFRINFADVSNCPTALKNNMGKGNGSCVGRINKSKFVIDIVQNYGFRFGNLQDISAIRKIAEEKGYLNAFEKGYQR